MIVFSFKDKKFQPRLKKKINDKKNVQIEIEEKLGPVTHVQQIQANAHKHILGVFLKCQLNVK